MEAQWDRSARDLRLISASCGTQVEFVSESEIHDGPQPWLSMVHRGDVT